MEPGDLVAVKGTVVLLGRSLPLKTKLRITGEVDNCLLCLITRFDRDV